MYKLSLCLQYLLKRALAYFAMFGVALCVFMMLISVSILNGFVDKIEQAAKGLFGDIVVSSAGLTGIGYYDEFIDDVKRRVPVVEGASPFILTFGLLQVPRTDYRRTVQIAGIRLPERATVSDFEKGLFVQEGLARPTFDPPADLVIQRLRQEMTTTDALLARESKDVDANGALSPGKRDLLGRISNALSYQESGLTHFLNSARTRGDLQRLRKQWAEADKAGNDAEASRLNGLISEAETQAILDPCQRVILGLGIAGLSFRTERGETVRVIGPGQNVVLSMIPLGRRLSAAEVTPSTRMFTVIDDCSTDVASIDSEIVYVPFRALQQLNNMAGERAADDANLMVTPARCSQIHLKVRENMARGEKLRQVARQVRDAWALFERAHPRAASTNVYVETWRERQSKLVSSIEAQRTLMVIILSIISFVAVLLIFVIFYVIVVQKTRDIGVLKAVGASSGGVAAIFLVYGAAIGLVGSLLGITGGYFFVHNINPIHDWVGRTFGFVVWSRETFMFARIPDEVSAVTAGLIAVGAILGGIAGAMVPALQAARKQPVEALRYE